MRVLVTGATGLVGSHVVTALGAAGHHVRALVRPASDQRALRNSGAEVFIGDVTDQDSLAPAVVGCDAVVHTAALVSDWAPWEQYFLVGVRGTRNVLDAAVRAGVKRFVHLSSIAVYGADLHGHLLRESDPYEHQPPNWAPYVRQKVLSEQLAFGYHRRHEIEVTAIRPSAIWGAGDRTFYPRLSALLGSPLSVIVGRGSNRIASVSARDVADVCCRAAALAIASGRAYNVSSERELTQREIYGLIALASGKPAPSRHISARVAFGAAAAAESVYAAAHFTRTPPLTRFGLLLIASDTRVDSSLARADLGWREVQSVSDAIRESAGALRGR
ncbi:MAG: NAD-dependent epimerase/dehydratase family protein [Dehalococcoidia bacterium]